MRRFLQNHLIWFVALVGAAFGALPLALSTLRGADSIGHGFVFFIVIVLFFLPASLILVQLINVSIWIYQQIRLYVWFCALPCMLLPYWLFAQLNNSLSHFTRLLLPSLPSFFAVVILVVAWLVMNIRDDKLSISLDVLIIARNKKPNFQSMFDTYMAGTIGISLAVILSLALLNATETAEEIIKNIVTDTGTYLNIAAFSVIGFLLCRDLQKHGQINRRYFINRSVVVVALANAMLSIYIWLDGTDGDGPIAFPFLTAIIVWIVQTPLCVFSALCGFWLVENFWLSRKLKNHSSD